MPQTNTREGRIKTADRVFRIIETVGEMERATLTEISATTGIPKSTLHAYLATLEELGYLDSRDGQFTLGLKNLKLGISARNNIEMMSEAEQILKDLAKKSSEIVWLATEDRGKVVYIECERDSQSVKTAVEVGQRDYMHCSAAGKAILAFLEEDRITKIIDQHGLPAQTPNTITERTELFAQLETIRQQGFATNNEETAEGIYAVSSPIIVDEEIHGSVTVSGPADQLNWEERRQEIIQMVKGASNEIALNLKYN